MHYWRNISLTARVYHHHIHYLSSYISFIVFQIKFQLATVTILFLLNKLVILLHFADISRTLVSFVSTKKCVSKTTGKLNISKHALSVAVP